MDFDTGGYRFNGNFGSKQLPAIPVMGKNSTKYAPILCIIKSEINIPTKIVTDSWYIWFWTEGRFGEPNHAGLEFYNRLIDVLLLKGNSQFFFIFIRDMIVTQRIFLAQLTSKQNI